MSETDKMSEEEIIKVLEDRLENSNQYVLYHSWVGTECFEAIQGLLDLYNKEKEKNKELEEFGEHIKIFREKNLSSEIDYVIALKSNFMGYLKTDYVSKDKIRETIKELEGQEIWYIQNKGLDELYGRIDMLKELLEEE